MIARHAATVTAILLLGIASAAHAQQATDTTKQASDSVQHARRRDQKMITRDTLKLHRDIAVRDSVRGVLQGDVAKAQEDGKKIDSVKVVLDKERRTTPRDTAAINRNLATVKRLQDTHDGELDKVRNEQKRAEFEDRAVRRESHADNSAHNDLRATNQAAKKTTSKR